MRIRIYQVDAFASKSFAGNPAAVCLSEEPLDEQTMHAIAAEKNLPMHILFERGQVPEGSRILFRTCAYQASQRGGELYVKLENERVKLGGQAITIMEGHLNL